MKGSWRDVDVAAQDVRDRVNRARRQLPDGIEEPIVRKLDPDAQAILWIAWTGDERWDAVRLSQYADERIKERLENLRGAGRIRIGGERRYAVRVELDPQRLAAHRMTVADVVATIRRNNVDIPTGRIESRRREFLVKTEGQFRAAGPINDLIVAYGEGGPVRIADVGTARDGVENDRQTARFRGRTSVGLGVVKQSDANTVALARAVRTRMARLAEDFPAGLSYSIASDSSRYVEESINSLLVTIGLATILVVLVVLGFLRNFWGTVITALAIPTSLLGGVTLMYALGFSVNRLTMLGLILPFGIVAFIGLIMLAGMATKNAILMIDYTNVLIARGGGVVEAAKRAAHVRFRPVMMTTISTVLGLMPIALGFGAGGEARAPMGVAVAAGLSATTLLTLVVIPVVYTLVRRPRSGS